MWQLWVGGTQLLSCLRHLCVSLRTLAKALVAYAAVHDVLQRKLLQMHFDFEAIWSKVGRLSINCNSAAVGCVVKAGTEVQVWRQSIWSTIA